MARPAPPTTRFLALATALVLAAGTSSTVALEGRARQATFRASVDLIAVDAQVVDRDGRPIPRLGPENFEVSIGGRRRNVVSADFIRSADVNQGLSKGARTDGPTAARLFGADPAAGTARTYIIAIDVSSFSVGDSRGVANAARGFLDRLQPQDLVGLYTFPLGTRIDPTLDRVAIRRKLDMVVGSKHGMQSEYNLTPSEVIDINAETMRSRATNLGTQGAGNAPTGTETEAIRRVQQRECGADVRCLESIQTEAQAMAFLYEGLVTEGLSGLRALVRLLGEVPGRKTVIMLSGGMLGSDRPGGRPDVGDLAKALGQDAAATNTSIYALHVDTTYMETYSAETRKTDKQPVSRSRDNALMGRTLDLFAGASGGAMIPVPMGSGEVALDRVLLETSAHYLLGVEPAAEDRDGKLRQLRVKVVNQSKATVRSRMWVIVPQPPLTSPVR